MTSHTAVSFRRDVEGSMQDICRSVDCQPVRSLIHQEETYFLDAFLINDHPFELCIFPILCFDTLGLCKKPALVLCFFSFAHTIANPASPAGKGVVDGFLILIFDSLLLLGLEFANNISSSKCSLDELLVLDSIWQADCVFISVLVGIRINFQCDRFLR